MPQAFLCFVSKKSPFIPCKKTITFLSVESGQNYILATPLFIAASATFAATVFPILSSNAIGKIYSSLSSSSDTRLAMAYDAAEDVQFTGAYKRSDIGRRALTYVK